MIKQFSALPTKSTLILYAVDTGGLGSRCKRTIFDDIPTYESPIIEYKIVQFTGSPSIISTAKINLTRLVTSLQFQLEDLYMSSKYGTN